MAKWPKLPPGSSNPFERDGKFDKPVAKRVEENRSGFEDRGCGDPRCVMCYPNNNYRGPALSGDRPNSNPSYSAGEVTNMANSKDAAEAWKKQQELAQGVFRAMAERNWVRNNPAVAAAPINAQLKKLRAEIEDMILTTPHDATWDEFIGNDEAKQAIIEAIEASTTHKEIYDFYQMKPSKGVVLMGPPGCGKTMLGKLAASALSRIHGKAAEVLITKDLESPFIGVTEQKITAIFAYAREYQKIHGFQLVIFIDEADTMLPQRGTSGKWKDSTVNTFLSEMDGLEANGAFVILASNRAEMIDEALMRDGRCSRKIKVVRPGYMEGKAMIYGSLRDAPLDHSLMSMVGGHNEIANQILDYLVHPARHLTTFKAMNVVTDEMREVSITLAHIMNGAMLTTLVERAKHYAFRRDIASGGKSGITMLDLTSAVDELVRDNKDLPHRYAAMEIMEEMQLREHDENAAARRKMN